MWLFKKKCEHKWEEIDRYYSLWIDRNLTFLDHRISAYKVYQCKICKEYNHIETYNNFWIHYTEKDKIIEKLNSYGYLKTKEEYYLE